MTTTQANKPDRIWTARDIANRLDVSTRWVTEIANRLKVGRIVGTTFIFNEFEARCIMEEITGDKRRS